MTPKRPLDGQNDDHAPPAVPRASLTRRLTRRSPVKFVRDVALTGGAQVVLALFSMLAGILVARLLGPEARGTLAVLVALGSTTVLLASLGVHQSSVYFLGRFPASRDEIISNTTLFGLMGGVLAGAVLAGAGVVFQNELLNGISLGLFLLYVLSVPFRYVSEFGRRLALGLDQIKVYNLPDYLEGAVLLMGTGLLLGVLGGAIPSLVALRVTLEVVVAVLLVVWIRRSIRFRFRPSWTLLKEQIRYGIRNYAGSLLWVFLLQSDLVLCNYFLGTAPTGVYAAAVSTGQPLSMMGNTLGVIVFHRAVAQSSRALRIDNTSQVIRLLFPIVLVTTVVLGAAAPWLISALYGEEFTGASSALILLLPGLAAFSLEVVMMSFIAGEGSPPVIYRAPLIGALVNVALNLVLIPRMGIDGAAVGSSIAYGVVLALVARFYMRSTGARPKDLLLVSRHDLSQLAPHRQR